MIVFNHSPSLPLHKPVLSCPTYMQRRAQKILAMNHPNQLFCMPGKRIVFASVGELWSEMFQTMGTSYWAHISGRSVCSPIIMVMVFCHTVL